MVIIQVALDFIAKKDAMKIASKIYDIKNLIFEVGTPLIKAEGVSVLREMKKNFPNVPLLADMKTMDVGKIEAKLAFDNGADYTTVLGVASRETISKVIETAKIYHSKVVIDLIGIKNISNFLSKIEGLTPDILCIHKGIDVVEGNKNKMFSNIGKTIEFLKKNTKFKIAVAGGITDKTAPIYVKYGADILVIGRYITRSRNPREAIKNIYKGIDVNI